MNLTFALQSLLIVRHKIELISGLYEILIYAIKMSLILEPNPLRIQIFLVVRE